jgi:hypothetical protein
MRCDGRWRRSTRPRACSGCRHLDYCVRPLLDEPWVLDVDATIKPLYGHQEGAVVGYNPRKPGRPSHCYHTYMLSDLRLVLRVAVHPGDQHNPKHAATGLWSLLAQLGRERWPHLLRGDAEWGNEGVMARAEREGLPYLFRLRATANVKRALERARLERCRPGLARQGNKPAADGVEPATTGGSAAPQV